MEEQYVHTYDGQAVLQRDVNRMGESGALADDRVFAELFRVAPFDGTNIARGIIPSKAPLIAGNGASGSVLVHPFRAFIGSRTAVATNAKKNLRDIRSGIAVGSTTLAQTVAIAANSSGNARWDLIYAVVTPDADAGAVERKMKDPTMKAISAVSVPEYRHTTVTLAVEEGATDALFPATPADGASSYNIPLGYVRVPNGFSAASTVALTDIAPKAPVLRLSGMTGGLSLSPATSNSVVSTTVQEAWALTGARGSAFMPASLTGGETLIASVDLRTGALSHADDAVVDSRDWRGRFFRSHLVVGNGSSARLAGDSSGAGVARTPENEDRGRGESGNFVASYFGQTLKDWDSDGLMVVAVATPDDVPNMVANSDITFYVDAATGALKVSYSSGADAPNRVAFLWVDWSGVYENAF